LSWAIALTVFVAVVATAAYLYSRPATAAKLSDTDTIVLADFANSTEDPVFDDTLRQALSVQLQQSPFLSLVPDTRIRQTLRLMGQSADAPLTPDVAQELCERSGGTAVLDGSITAPPARIPHHAALFICLFRTTCDEHWRSRESDS
jgi:hypothetical protein